MGTKFAIIGTTVVMSMIWLCPMNEAKVADKSWLKGCIWKLI